MQNYSTGMTDSPRDPRVSAIETNQALFALASVRSAPPRESSYNSYDDAYYNRESEFGSRPTGHGGYDMYPNARGSSGYPRAYHTVDNMRESSRSPVYSRAMYDQRGVDNSPNTRHQCGYCGKRFSRPSGLKVRVFSSSFLAQCSLTCDWHRYISLLILAKNVGCHFLNIMTVVADPEMKHMSALRRAVIVRSVSEAICVAMCVSFIKFHHLLKGLPIPVRRAMVEKSEMMYRTLFSDNFFFLGQLEVFSRRTISFIFFQSWTMPCNRRFPFLST